MDRSHLKKRGVYRNLKTGNYYVVKDVARHSETLEEVVVYRSVAKRETWVRPLPLFLEKFEPYASDYFD